MNKRFVSIIALSIFAVTLGGCGTHSTSGENPSSEVVVDTTVFKTAATSGFIEFETVDEELQVFYVNSMIRNDRFDIRDVALDFSVGENDGKYTSFMVIDDILCYPNIEGTEGKYYWRAIAMKSATGKQFISTNDEYIYNETTGEKIQSQLKKAGIKDLSKLVVDGYLNLVLQFDMNANEGNNFGEVLDSEYFPK